MIQRDRITAVEQCDRDAAKALSQWLYDHTKGAVNAVATDDSFEFIQAFARHRVQTEKGDAPQPDLQTWELCVGSCQRHKQCMYKPCRTVSTPSRIEGNQHD